MVGKVIHGELCKRLKFDYSAKWYMHKPESILENETQKILRDLKIQIDHLIPVRRQDIVLINKKRRTHHQVDLVILAEHRGEMKENKKIDKYLNFARVEKICGT